MDENDIRSQQEKHGEEVREIIASKSRFRELVTRAGGYIARYRPRLGTNLTHSLSTVLRLGNAYLRGEYRDVSKSTLSLLAFGLLYFVSPIDLIPDFLIPIGFVDDAFVLGWVVQRLSGELIRFRSWERAGACRALLPSMDFDRIESVLLIAGWFSETTDYAEHVALVKTIYRNADVSLFRWKSNGFWESALRQADGEAPVALLKKLDLSNRERTVLIGHSLGGRIVVRTLAQWNRAAGPHVEHLRADDVQVDTVQADDVRAPSILQYRVAHTLLMGAAIDCDDAAIAPACTAVRDVILNFHNKADGVLRYLYKPYQGKNALGATGLSEAVAEGCPVVPPNWHDLIVSGNEEHVLGLIENAAALGSLFKSKAPFKMLRANPDLLKSLGNMHRHQFLNYIQFYKDLVSSDK